MNLTLTNPTRPASYRGLDLGENANWQEERVSFPHCRRCITDRVQELGKLDDNWDGYGAKPIAPAMIAAVRQFLERLEDEHGELLLKPGTETDCLVPHCGARSSGTVQLEWQIGDRSLELEFEKPEEIRYLKWWPGHDLTDEEESYPAADLSQSASLIRWVLTGDDAPAQ